MGESASGPFEVSTTHTRPSVSLYLSVCMKSLATAPMPLCLLPTLIMDSPSNCKETFPILPSPNYMFSFLRLALVMVSLCSNRTVTKTLWWYDLCCVKHHDQVTWGAKGVLQLILYDP